jgi:hypothetical protein
LTPEFELSPQLPAEDGRTLALDIGPFANGAEQPRSVGQNVRPVKKGVDTRLDPLQVNAKQALVALYDPAADDDGVDIPDVGAFDNQSFRIAHRYEVETIGVDKDHVGHLTGRPRTSPRPHRAPVEQGPGNAGAGVSCPWPTNRRPLTSSLRS